MSDELELLRGFRAQDAVVDAASAHAARARLLAHIAQPDGVARPRGRGFGHWTGALRGHRLSWGVVATGLAVGVMIAVGAVFLTLHRQPVAHHPPPTAHGHHHHQILRNVAPARPAKLAGQFFCNASLAKPGAVAGLGGARTGEIVVHTARIRGANRSPFTITARGLPPSGRHRRYAVWLFQTTGQASDVQPVAGVKPLLLGVISPGVGSDGRLAVEGVLPTGVSGGYILRITIQPHASLSVPGRTVLQGATQL